jgi:hypothetical protein
MKQTSIAALILLASCNNNTEYRDYVQWKTDSLYHKTVEPLQKVQTPAKRYFFVGWYSSYGDGGEKVGNTSFSFDCCVMPTEDSLKKWIKCCNKLTHDVFILSISEMNELDFNSFEGKNRTFKPIRIDSLKCK